MKIVNLFDLHFKLAKDPAGHISAIADIRSEETLRIQLTNFLSGIALIVAGQSCRLPIGVEEMCSVGGQVCKLVKDKCEVDLHAGILTFTDLKIAFGHPKYEGRIFSVCQLKRNHGKVTALKQHWYREGKAMFSQLHAGILGEGARLGMAMMPEGFKVVMVREVIHEDGRKEYNNDFIRENDKGEFEGNDEKNN